MMKQTNNYISIGKILNFHGIQGEAKVGYSKNQADFLKTLVSVFIFKDGEYLPIEVKYVKFNNKFAIMKFAEINSINEIVEYKNCLIYVPISDVEKNLGEDEFLINDLVGMDVYLGDKKEGVVVGVSNNGANDLLTIRGLSKKISLVPFVKDLVPEIDVKAKKVFISDVKGLIE